MTFMHLPLVAFSGVTVAIHTLHEQIHNLYKNANTLFPYLKTISADYIECIFFGRTNLCSFQICSY